MLPQTAYRLLNVPLKVVLIAGICKSLQRKVVVCFHLCPRWQFGLLLSSSQLPYRPGEQPGSSWPARPRAQQFLLLLIAIRVLTSNNPWADSWSSAWWINSLKTSPGLIIKSPVRKSWIPQKIVSNTISRALWML